VAIDAVPLPETIPAFGPAAVLATPSKKLSACPGQFSATASNGPGNIATFTGSARGNGTIVMIGRSRIAAGVPNSWVTPPLSMQSPHVERGAQRAPTVPAVAWENPAALNRRPGQLGSCRLDAIAQTATQPGSEGTVNARHSVPPAGDAGDDHAIS
jgi:hypothetical protein